MFVEPRENGERGGLAPRVYWAGLICGLLLAGCGDDERPAALTDRNSPAKIAGCTSFSYEPCDVTTAECQSELFGLVACMRGESLPDALPPVRLLDEAAARAVVLEEPSTAMNAGPEMGTPDFATEVRGLELLGLLEPGLIGDVADAVDVTLEASLAFYLPGSDQVVIIDRGEPIDDLASNATLAHEFVHALQDARHDLTQFIDTNGVDTDSALAIASVVEGEATLYELLMRFAYDGVRAEQVDFEQVFNTMMLLAEDMTLSTGSPMLTARGIFPYTYGLRFVGQQWLAGGEDALGTLYATPPVRTLQVLNTSPYAAPTAPGTPAPSAPEPLDNYALVVDDVAGAWIVAALVAQRTPADLPEPGLWLLAADWSSDHLWVYRSSEPDAAVTAIWSVTWQLNGAATHFADLLQDWAPPGASSRVITVGNTTHLVVAERAADLDAWAAQYMSSSP